LRLHGGARDNTVVTVTSVNPGGLRSIDLGYLEEAARRG
jgi:hypothetical protein